jgi:hypothetical protein
VKRTPDRRLVVKIVENVTYGHDRVCGRDRVIGKRQ